MVVSERWIDSARANQKGGMGVLGRAHAPIIMIIGLVGKNGSGKGEVANFLTSIGFIYHSLSDIVREQLKNRDLEITRENLIEIGTEMRRQFGPSVLAERVLEKLDPDKNYVIDSIRNPFEAKALKKKSNFRLVNVVADEQIRFERVKARNRENDPQTLEEFRRLESAEMTRDDPSRQQLSATEELADVDLENNGTIRELHEATRRLVQRISRSIERPDWDEYFMKIAQTVAMRSNCIKRKVAAIIVKDRRIISTGYNGTPRGLPNCNEGGCPRCNSLGESGKGLEDCYCCHAEENAIVQAAYHGVNIKGSTIYSTYSPCLLCTKMIINSGISEVVFTTEYSIGDVAMKLLQKAGVKIRQMV